MNIGRIFKTAIKVFLAVALVLLAQENYLSFKGWQFEPNRKEFLPSETLPLYDTCGTVLKPGCRPSYENPSALETVEANGQRKSRNTEKKSDKRALVLGCSYTYGMGVNDNETFVWLLNEAFPNICFDNYGVVGYSTYQCLMAMEHFLNLAEAQNKKYHMVIYCCIGKHFLRNCERNIPGNISSLPLRVNPYAELSKGELLKRPANYHTWPLENQLRIVNFLKSVYVGRKVALQPRENISLEYQKRVFDTLLGQMQKTCASHKAQFLLVAIDPHASSLICTIPHGMHYLDASFAPMDQAQWRVNGKKENHPNPKVHKIWSEKIASWIKNMH